MLVSIGWLKFYDPHGHPLSGAGVCGIRHGDHSKKFSTRADRALKQGRTQRASAEHQALPAKPWVGGPLESQKQLPEHSIRVHIFHELKKWHGSDTKTTQDIVMQQMSCRQHSGSYNCKRLRSKWGSLSPIAFDKKIGNSTTYWCVRKNSIPITLNDDYLRFPSRHWFKSHMASWCL